MGSARGRSQSFQCAKQTWIHLSRRRQHLENISFQHQQSCSRSRCWWEDNESNLPGFQTHAQHRGPARHPLFLIPLPPSQDTGMSRTHHTRGEGWASCTGRLPPLPTLTSHTPGCWLTQGRTTRCLLLLSRAADAVDSTGDCRGGSVPSCGRMCVSKKNLAF